MESSTSDKTGAKSTRDRIMLEAAILFAQRGYAAVSVRDIAKQANIKSASIYNHFSGKEELFDVIVDNIKNIYLNYYPRQDLRMQEANSFEELLEKLFVELLDVYDIFVYYGVSLIATEQFRNRKAMDVLNNVVMKIGIDYSKTHFDRCVQRKWVKPFDTEALSTLFMNSIIVGTLMRTHEYMEHDTPYDVTKMFESLRRYMLNSVEIIDAREESRPS